MTTPKHKIPLSAHDDTLRAAYLLLDAINVTEDGDTHGFEPYMPPGHFWAIRVLTAVLTLLGLGLNALALVSILKFFYHFSVSCRFVINLLLTNLLFSAVVLCRLMLGLVPKVAHSRALCLGFFSAMMCTGSTAQLSLLLALLDNFVTVVFPFRYRSILTCRAAHVAIAVVWFYSVGAMVVLPNLSAFNDWRSSLACRFNQVIARSFRTFMAVQFGVVTLVLVGLYVKVLVVAVGHHRKMMRQADHLSVEEKEKIRDRCSNVQCKGLMVLCFFVCWLPLCIVQAVESLLAPVPLTVVLNYATLFIVLNSAANPVVCVWRNRHFRMAVKSLLGLKDSTETINITIMSA